MIGVSNNRTLVKVHSKLEIMDKTKRQLTGQFGRKEGNVLFNDTLNRFYLRLYGVRHMVKDHSDSERGNPLQPHRLLFPNSRSGQSCSARLSRAQVPN